MLALRPLTAAFGDSRSRRGKLSRPSWNLDDIADRLMPWGTAAGALCGLVIGFQGAGLGGAVLGIILGAIGGWLVAIFLPHVVFGLWAILVWVVIIGGLVLLIGGLWGVGRP